jgi:hypothetical protein
MKYVILIVKFFINVYNKLFNENKQECGEIVETARLIESDGSTSIHLEYKEKR